MKRICIILVLAVFHYSHGQPQSQSNHALDSMKQMLVVEENLSSRYFLYQNIINHYGHGPYDSLWKYVNEAVNYFQQKEALKFQYASNFLKARTFYDVGLLDSAKAWYKKAKHYASQIEGSDKAARIDSQIAWIYLEQDSLFKALDYAKRTELAFENSNNVSFQRSIYHLLSSLMHKMQRYSDMLAYVRKSYKLAQNKTDSLVSYHNFYGPLILLKKYDSAKLVLDSERALVDEGSANHFLLLVNYSHLYLEEDYKGYDPAKALNYLEEVRSYDYLHLYANRSDSLNFHINVAIAHLSLGHPQKAEPHIAAFKELTNKTNSKVNEYKYYWILSKYYAGLKDFEKAYDYHVKYKKLKDSYSNANIQNQLYMLSRSYELEKRDSKIEALNMEKEIQRLEASTYLKQRNAFLAFAGLFLLGGIVITRQSLLRKKTNGLLTEKKHQLEIAIEDKETLLKEIHHRVKNNLQVISSLLNLQAENLSSESALEAITEGQNRVKTMSLIHQRLYQTNDLRGVDVYDYLKNLIPQLINSFNLDSKEIDYKIDVRNMKLDVDTLVPLGLIINELVTNSLKYAFEEMSTGIIELTMREKNDKLHVRIKDNGKGLDKTALESSNSFGWKMIASLSRKLKAELSILNEDGTVIDIMIDRFKLVL
ncbi:histidine kinase dimerization/phosphoacceptor domain -containing protein [Ekhidna sp.]|uniref:histidine kinase dimerization/phosphoacceptor domain -containing protein n=1 Tax=Ekhidna sp. TaxID=2608089 RepID=UPI003C7A6190